MKSRLLPMFAGFVTAFLGVLPDVAAILVFGHFAVLKLITPEVATGLVLSVITARAYGRKPGGGGGLPPASGVAVVAAWGLFFGAKLLASFVPSWRVLSTALSTTKVRREGTKWTF